MVITSAPTVTRPPHPGGGSATEPAGHTPDRARSRDRFLDLVRLVAIALVVIQHWLMPMLAVDDGAIVMQRAFVLEDLWPLTWVTQVMPVVFFAAGAAAVHGLRGRAPDRSWIARRLVRLGGGVCALAAVWLPLPVAFSAAGLDPTVVSTGGRLIGALLWFLVVLVVLSASTPLLLRLAERFRGAEIGVLVAAAVVVDGLRFGLGWEAAGYLNAVLIWGAVYAVGLHHARGAGRWLSGGRAAAFGLAGFAVLALAVTVGPYPPAMIGLPGTAVSNMNPPSVAVLALAAGQLGLLLAARPWIARFAERRQVARLVDAAAPSTMAVYLWHTPALVLTSAVVVAIGSDAPDVGTLAWWAGVPLWTLGLMTALLVLVRAFGRAGLRASGDDVGAARALVGGLLVGVGLLVLTMGGFDPDRLADAIGPLVGTWALGCGLLLLGARPGWRPAAVTAGAGALSARPGTLVA